MGIVLLLGAVIGLFGLNFPLFRRDVETAVSVGGKVQSKASYYQGALSKGVFVVGDVGEDQNVLKSLAQDYYGSGASVMVMDLSGHGSAVQALDPDKASDRLVQEVRGGLEAFRKKSGLEDGNILVVGHGYGARALLQIIASDQPAFMGASLISPYVILDGEDGGSIYLGRQDDNKTGWVNSLSANSISIPLQLIASEKDDVVSQGSVQELYRKLTGSAPALPKGEEKKQASSSKAASDSDGEDPGEEEDSLTSRLYNTLINGSSTKTAGVSSTSGNVTFTLLPSGYHPYQMFSNSTSAASKNWAHYKAGLRTVSTTSFFPLLRVICWCAAVIALITISACSMALSWNRYPGISRDRCGISLYPWRSLVIRLLLWAAGGLVGLILWLVFSILPLGEPSGRLLPTASMAGYGFALLLLYLIKKMPGASGSIQTFTGTLSLWRTATSIAMLAGLCAVVWFLGDSGLFQTLLGGDRVFWMIAFTAVMSVFFYTIELDADVFSDNDGGLLLGFLHRAVLLLPFLAVCLFQWMAGSYSACFRLLCSTAAFIICLNFSAAFHRHSGARLLPAIGVAFLYSMMVVPSAVLLA